MGLSSPDSAILSAVIFNALIIVALIPLALRGVQYRPSSAPPMLRRNLLDLRPRRPGRAVHRHQAHRPRHLPHPRTQVIPWPSLRQLVAAAQGAARPHRAARCALPAAVLAVGQVAARARPTARSSRSTARSSAPACSARPPRARSGSRPARRPPTTPATPAAASNLGPNAERPRHRGGRARGRPARGQPGRTGDDPARRAHGIRQRARPAHLAGVRRLPGAAGGGGARDERRARCSGWWRRTPSTRPWASSARTGSTCTELNVALETADAATGSQ